jgi:hypothetical protein
MSWDDDRKAFSGFGSFGSKPGTVVEYWKDLKKVKAYEFSLRKTLTSTMWTPRLRL